MLAGDIAAKRFTRTKWREGYDQGDVDAFLDRVHSAFVDHERGRPTTSLTEADVVTVRFRPTRFREGYAQGEVDDFLDEVVVALRSHPAR